MTIQFTPDRRLVLRNGNKLTGVSATEKGVQPYTTGAIVNLQKNDLQGGPQQSF